MGDEGAGGAGGLFAVDGLLGGGREGGERGGVVAGGEEVARAAGGGGGAVGEHGGDGAVPAGEAVGAAGVVEEGLAEEVVGEGEAVVGGGDEEAGVEEGVERGGRGGREGGVGEAGVPFGVVDAFAEHGGELEGAAGGGVAGEHAVEVAAPDGVHGVGEVVGGGGAEAEAVAGVFEGVGLDPVFDEGAGEEGVAVGAGDGGGEEVGARGRRPLDLFVARS